MPSMCFPGDAPIAQTTESWNDLPLRIALFGARVPVPPDLVTSVRAVVLRERAVLLLRNRDGVAHVVPGGRCAPGESLLATLHREVREETGWTIARCVPIGSLQHRHLGPRPAGYAYPYPEFWQALYCATAERHDTVPDDDFEQSAAFVSIDEALAALDDSFQRAILRVALAHTEFLAC